ncbi:MAG: GIY-YIG catalytic domain protein [Betaproteobacteria bacterium ADurb.Bin341]|nr:MAG: GIY-YIG catalytic domain protein [Betaproteobacteria bacterium ADurb.Bin341]
MITVYVLHGNTTNKRYVGITNDLPRRLNEHRKRPTAARRAVGVDFQVLLTELFPDYSSADREAAVPPI